MLDSSLERHFREFRVASSMPARPKEHQDAICAVRGQLEVPLASPLVRAEGLQEALHVEHLLDQLDTWTAALRLNLSADGLRMPR